MFRNLLVHVNGSPASRAALAQAIEIARVSGGRIGLSAAIPRVSPWISTPPFAPSTSRRQMELELGRETQRSVEEAEQAVPVDIPVTKLVMRAKPADALLTHVRSGRWDVVIVGHRLAGCPFATPHGITRLLRGSPVPVLVMSERCDADLARDAEEGRRAQSSRPLAAASGC